MDLSRLLWIKNVLPSKSHISLWAYTQEELHRQNGVMLHDGRLNFPLMFKRKGAQKPSYGESILLTQHARVTHIVELQDHDYFEHQEVYFRWAKIVWIAPGDRNGHDWSEMPHRDDVLKFGLPNQMKTVPYRLDSFESYRRKWSALGHDMFVDSLKTQLALIPDLSLNSLTALISTVVK